MPWPALMSGFESTRPPLELSAVPQSSPPAPLAGCAFQRTSKAWARRKRPTRRQMPRLNGATMAGASRAVDRNARTHSGPVPPKSWACGCHVHGRVPLLRPRPLFREAAQATNEAQRPEPLPVGTVQTRPPSPAVRSALNSRSAPTIAAEATVNHFTRLSPMSVRSAPAAPNRASASLAAMPRRVADLSTRTVASAREDAAGRDADQSGSASRRTASMRLRTIRQLPRASVKS